MTIEGYLNPNHMRAIELMMEQQERLTHFIEKSKPISTERSVRTFFAQSDFERRVLTQIQLHLQLASDGNGTNVPVMETRI